MMRFTKLMAKVLLMGSLLLVNNTVTHASSQEERDQDHVRTIVLCFKTSEMLSNSDLMSKLFEQQEQTLNEIKCVLSDEMEYFETSQLAANQKNMIHKKYLSFYLRDAEGYYNTLNRIIKYGNTPYREQVLEEFESAVNSNTSRIKSCVENSRNGWRPLSILNEQLLDSDKDLCQNKPALISEVH